MTALHKKLPGPGLDDIVIVARRQFVRGERIDLPAIADQLGISRATAYRWVGNADELTGLVISRLMEDTFTRLKGETKNLRGARRILEMLERGMREIAAFKPLKEFLNQNPEKGLRLIASKDGPVQRFTIKLHQSLLEEEIERGALQLPIDAHTMAYAITRLSESFLYGDLIAGEKPEFDKVITIVRLMLRPDVPRSVG